MKFKIGDRVRIVEGDFIGKEATIIEIDEWDWQDECVRNGTIPAGSVCYLLDVDGVGDSYPDDPNFSIAAYGGDIVPLINPDEQAWEAFKSLHLKPDPALILAKGTA